MSRQLKMGRRLAMSGLGCAFLVLFASQGWCGEAPARSKGQTLYAPAYSHVFHGDRNQPFLLTVTLVVRNPDPMNSITLLSADYYGSKGKRIEKYVKDPVTVGPLSSVEFVVQETDKRGGPGACFLVRWSSGKPAVPPVVETIMIGTAAAQGISFVSESRVIAEPGD